MYPKVIFGKRTVVEVNDARGAVVEADAFVGVFAKNEGLVVVEKKVVVVFGVFVSKRGKGPVVEDIAVLVYFKKRTTPVCIRAAEHFAEVFDIAVHRSGHEGSIGAEGYGYGVDGVVEGAKRGGGRVLIFFGSGRILAFGQAVYLIVEQEDIEVEVAPQYMDEVIAANGEAIAIAGNDPYVQPGVGHAEAGGNSRCAPVNAVHSVGVHVIGKPAGATDAGNEDRFVLFFAQFGQYGLHLFEYGIVATAGAPSHVLVGGEVFSF